MAISNMLDYLSDEERKEYEAAEKRIEELLRRKHTIQLTIDNLREGIVVMNLEISKRNFDYMMKKTPTQ